MEDSTTGMKKTRWRKKKWIFRRFFSALFTYFPRNDASLFAYHPSANLLWKDPSSFFLNSFFFLYAHRVPCFFIISFCNELLRMWLAIFEIWCYTQSLPVLLKVKRNENIDASFECLKQKCPRMCTQIISNQFFEDAKPIKRQILPNDF